MPNVRDIMTTDVVILDEHMTLREAIDVLSKARVSGAPVMAGSVVVGVASRTDILDFEADAGDDPERGSGGPVLGDDRVDTPDFDEENPPGAYYLDSWGDPEAEAWSAIPGMQDAEVDRLDEHSIAEVMTRSLAAVDPGASIRDTARLMAEGRVHRLLVMENRELRGVVSTMDIVRAVAEGLDTGD